MKGISGTSFRREWWRSGREASGWRRGEGRASTNATWKRGICCGGGDEGQTLEKWICKGQGPGRRVSLSEELGPEALLSSGRFTLPVRLRGAVLRTPVYAGGLCKSARGLSTPQTDSKGESVCCAQDDSWGGARICGPAGAGDAEILVIALVVLRRSVSCSLCLL